MFGNNVFDFFDLEYSQILVDTIDFVLHYFDFILQRKVS